MRRIQKILTGIFLTGVVIGGVGTGIAIVEYSSMSYGGKKIIGEENIVTKNLDFQFEPDGRVVELTGLCRGRGGRKTVVEIDDAVPVGTVRYQVSYNEKTVTPYLEFTEYEEEEQETDQWETAGKEETEMLSVPENGQQAGEDRSQQEASEKSGPLGELRLGAEYHDSGFGLLMENKDYILEELKHNRVSGYEVAYITEVTVRIHSQTAPYISAPYVIR